MFAIAHYQGAALALAEQFTPPEMRHLSKDKVAIALLKKAAGIFSYMTETLLVRFSVMLLLLLKVVVVVLRSRSRRCIAAFVRLRRWRRPRKRFISRLISSAVRPSKLTDGVSI